uniref:N-acetyltransferase n=1 Tax=Janibacter limosus TaxID=53458 RepID=A0AC61U3S0_9MICO|nr:GNAT family N-acetyltransferase [Janibacter limosus]
MPDIVVTDDADKGRFEAHQGAVLVGFAEYQLTDDLYVFTHTRVDPAHEGRGVGGALARGALDRVREDGTRRCWRCVPSSSRGCRVTPTTPTSTCAPRSPPPTD